MKYSATAIVIHWVTAAAVALAVALGLRMGSAGGAEREGALALHASIGVSLLALTVLRVIWHKRHPPPPLPSVRQWEQRAARVTHATFYVLLIVVPLLGWAFLSTSTGGTGQRWFGLFALPALPGMGGNDGLAGFAEGAHRFLAYGLCALLGLHIAAALKHHLADPTSGLLRVLPGSRRRPGWQIGGLTAALIATFVLGAGYADSVLPRALHLVREPAPRPVVAIDPRKAHVFASVMLPILQEKCAGCHGKDSQKGGLRVDSFAALMKGGEGGRAIVPGKADESALVHRILLPPTDKEAMPPAGRPPLSAAEGQLLLWWIGAGADEAKTIAAASPPPLVQGILENLGVRSESAVFAVPVAIPDAQTLQQVRETFDVRFIYAGAGFLQVQPRFDRDPDRPLAIDALLPVAEQLVWLDLGSSGDVSKEQLASLRGLRKLQRLNLARVDVDDGTVGQLRALPNLEMLNLYGTSVTDEAFEALGQFSSLSSVYLTGTKVSTEGVERFRKAHPDVRVVWQPGDTARVESRSIE